ncbi:MAG: hypothetical protein JWM95_902 [Gemmatimonadetes bacterium]|nr:hypothetical protein [Gemmatimonadota bacterium]
MTAVPVASDAGSRKTVSRLHAAPAWTTIVLEQIRAVGLLARLAGLVVVGVGVMLSAVAVWNVWTLRTFNEAHPKHLLTYPDFTFIAEAGIVMVGIACLLPFMVWQDEDPTRRLYHWAMPVSRPAHALAKVFAGWFWLMCLTLVYLVWVAGLAGVTTLISGQPQPQSPTFRLWEWCVPFTSATVTYVLISAATVGARRPLVWIGGVITMFMGASLLLSKLGKKDAFEHFTRAVLNGTYGIATALGRVHFDDATQRASLPRADFWLGASAIWCAIGVAALLAVSCRHTEPL